MKRLWIAAELLLILLGTAFLVQQRTSITDVTFWLLFPVLMITLYRPVLALWFRLFPPRAVDTTEPVDILIPVYNEDPKLFKRHLLSVLNQTYPSIGRIIYTDDGSSTANCLNLLHQQSDPRLIVSVHPKNEGKRHALATCLSQSSAPYLILCDSDVILEPDAVANLMKYQVVDGIDMVSGRLAAHNKDVSLFTKTQHILLVNSFTVVRPSQSVFGSVMCASGMMMSTRAIILRDNLHDYLNQSFLGKRIEIGDDRRLTSYALRHGRVVQCPELNAQTKVMESISHFLKQQIRWSRSYFRESFLLIGNLDYHRMYWYVNLFELSVQFLTMAILLTALINPSIIQNFSVLFVGGLFVVNALTRSISMLQEAPLYYLFSPVLSLIHAVFIVPIRWLALATITNNRWGNR